MLNLNFKNTTVLNGLHFLTNNDFKENHFRHNINYAHESRLTVFNYDNIFFKITLCKISKYHLARSVQKILLNAWS